MAFQWHHDAVRTRQHRSSTEPVPPPQPPFPPIPPSLIPGNRHRQTISVTPTANGLLYSGHGTGTYPMAKVPAFPPVSSYAMNPSPYRDFQPPLPPPPPLPQAQSQVFPRQQQPVVPPLPPKTPISTPPSLSPTVPPKPPPFVPPPPPTHTRPKLSTRSQSQPPPPKPRSSSSSLPPPPPPIPPPPRPLGARSASYKVTSTSSLLLLQPHATPSAKPSPPAKEQPDTDAAPQQTSLPATAPAKGHFGMNEEEEFELALELSAHTVREHANSLLSQDEELARALEESLHDSPPQPVQPRLQPDRLVIDSENVPSSSSMKLGDTYTHGSRPSSHAPSPLLAPSPVDAQLREDEAFARRLEAAYENEPNSPTTAKDHRADPSSSAFPPLPRYADVVGKETVVERLESDAVASPRVQQQVSPISAPADDRLSVPDQANTPPRNSPSPAQRSSPRPEALEITGSPSEEEEVLESASSSPQSSRPLATPNEFVEPELLYGVSFGFNTPPMDNLEMRGSVPNIIALPFGKSPPMYIRAPSWRQLLKLMAKLSATRVEPSVEALAVTKGELQLRTVIQFFKLHQNSSDWRTVVYLTIDYPPPPDYRYTNMDVNILPYSYGLSTLPALLRNGPDSHISKYYTIPATARTPLPKLPISLPNLAMYLTAALEESRRALGDSSSGLRRLAKMIDQFYPNQASHREAGDEEVRRRGGRAFIGRLMGRSSRPQGGRNADVYDLVTPFVPDEWG